jgi:hypothetical protein
MGAELQRTRSVVDEARLARLNARRLVIQACYLTEKAKELQRAALRTRLEASHRR